MDHMSVSMTTKPHACQWSGISGVFFQALASNLSVSAFNTGVSDSIYAQQNNYKKQKKSDVNMSPASLFAKYSLIWLVSLFD